MAASLRMDRVRRNRAADRKCNFFRSEPVCWLERRGEFPIANRYRLG
jgi:hypothetical protein